MPKSYSPSEAEEFMTLAEAATYLGLDENTLIWDSVRPEPKLTSQKAFGNLFFRKADVVAKRKAQEDLNAEDNREESERIQAGLRAAKVITANLEILQDVIKFSRFGR